MAAALVSALQSGLDRSGDPGDLDLRGSDTAARARALVEAIEAMIRATG